MGFFPGKQSATPSSRGGRSRKGSSETSKKSKPTPLKTSPYLTPQENARRMAINRARGVGDSQGRSTSDPNFGKGSTAPRSQFRSGGGASLKSATVKTRVVSRSEFQRSLALKQQRSKAVRRFLKPLQEQRRKTGATERRNRIDALTTKQRIVKEIRGFPLTELGRKDKQAVIDFIDKQFEPFLNGKQLLNPGSARKIEMNLGIFLRKKGTKAVSRPITPKEKKKYANKPVSTLTAVEKKKGLAGVRQTLSKQRDMARQKSQTDKSQIRRTFTGIGTLGLLGAASGVVGVAETIRHPLKTAKNQIEAIKQPIETIKYLGEEFTVDPVGTVAEFYAFSKSIKIGGQGIKRSPTGRFVQEELFIRSQPKQVQSPVRKILRAARVQEKINPLKVKNIRKVDFLEAKRITKAEAEALSRVLKKTDTVVFGSWSARTLGGKKLPKPKDIDLATRDKRLFNQKLMKEIPKKLRKNYMLKGEKIFRKTPGEPIPIFDVKPLDKLIPQRNLFTGRGSIPAVGYVTRIKGIETARRLLRINKNLEKLKNKITSTKTKTKRAKLKRRVQILEKQKKIELKKFKPTDIIKFRKKLAVGRLEFPTQRLVKLDLNDLKRVSVSKLEKILKKNKLVEFRRVKEIKEAPNAHGMLSFKNDKPIITIKKGREVKELDVIAHELTHLSRFYKFKKISKLPQNKLTTKLKLKLKMLQDEIATMYLTPLNRLFGFKISKKNYKIQTFSKNIKTFTPVFLSGVSSVTKILTTSFGEQTVRKALGTLQVIIEKNPLRAKDPQALLKALEVQRAALKRSKKLTLFKKRKLKTLDSAIKMLKSKAFAKLLERKVPGLNNEFPLVAKMSVSKLKKVDFQKIRDQVIKKTKKAKPTPLARRERKAEPKKKLKKKKAKPSKKKRSSRTLKRRRPSKLPKKKPSRLPSSRLKRRKPSRLRPSKPSKVRAGRSRPSKLTPGKPSKVRPSKLKPSKTPHSKPSKLKPSRLRPSRLRPGRPSRLTNIQIRRKLLKLPKGAPRPPPVLLKKPRTRKEEERLIKWVRKQKQIYRPSLAAILFEITGIPKLKITGFEIRPIPIKIRVKKRIKKKPKRLKRKTTSRRRKKK